MATQTQVEANRCNSHSSPAPPSDRGQGPPRFDAMKSSIDAQAHVISGEDAAELTAVIESYREKFLPDNALGRFLVDEMIGADWESRRLRNIEAQLWQRELAQGSNLVDVYTSNQGLVRLERRKDATKRAYYRALKEMQRIIQAEEQADQFRERSGNTFSPEELDPESGSFQPNNAADEAPPSAELGSFPPNASGESGAPEAERNIREATQESPGPRIGFVPPKRAPESGVNQRREGRDGNVAPNGRRADNPAGAGSDRLIGFVSG
jgi:hypothetical protein